MCSLLGEVPSCCGDSREPLVLLLSQPLSDPLLFLLCDHPPVFPSVCLSSQHSVGGGCSQVTDLLRLGSCPHVLPLRSAGLGGALKGKGDLTDISGPQCSQSGLCLQGGKAQSRPQGRRAPREWGCHSATQHCRVLGALSNAACMGQNAHVPSGGKAGKGGCEARAAALNAPRPGQPKSLPLLLCFAGRSLRAVFWTSLRLLRWPGQWGQTWCWGLPGPLLLAEFCCGGPALLPHLWPLES